MKRHMLRTAGTLVIVLMASSGVVWADQARPRNPGAAGGSSGGSSGSSGGSSSGGDTGRVAVPRGGGSAPWGGGSTVTSRPTQPTSGGTTTTANRSGRGVTGSSDSAGTVPGYSRPRDGAFATGRAIPRTSIGTLPPIISGPVYWGAGDAWYFYPWGYGALGLGYLWDPWFWGGYGGYWGAGSPAWGSGMGWGGGGYTGYGSSGGGGYSSSSSVQSPDVTGGLRLRVTPRSAQVYVDGYFAGKVDDFDGAFQRLKLPPGPHRVDVQADGYETLSFDVLVIEDEVTTYKGALVRQP